MLKERVEAEVLSLGVWGKEMGFSWQREMLKNQLFKKGEWKVLSE